GRRSCRAASSNTPIAHPASWMWWLVFEVTITTFMAGLQHRGYMSDTNRYRAQLYGLAAAAASGPLIFLPKTPRRWPVPGPFGFFRQTQLKMPTGYDPRSHGITVSAWIRRFNCSTG